MADSITPPPELVQQWCHEDGDEIKTSPRWFHSVCAKAAQWGADQELEATLGLMETLNVRGVDYIRNARRPKPPSLKEQALEALAAIEGDFNTVGDRAATIRRALEALDD